MIGDVVVMVDVVSKPNETKPVNWEALSKRLAADNERLASSNERFRTAIMAIQDMAKTRSQVIMLDGTPLGTFCTSLLTQ